MNAGDIIVAVTALAGMALVVVIAVAYIADLMERRP